MSQPALLPVLSPQRALADEPEDRGYKLHRRFDRMGRLVGDDGMARLLASHAIVVGLGGVGSWAAEALARAGVGRLTLVDFDLVCVTNGNRQLHAMKGTTGKPKVEVMADRLRLVHPGCDVRAVREFYDAESADRLLGDGADVVVDAIDNLSAKAHLIASCRARGLPLVVSGGASGRMDPTQLRVKDLGKVRDDPFLAAVRKILRQKYDFPAANRWGITAVCSLEEPQLPRELTYDGGCGFSCVCPQGAGHEKHSCDSRHVIYGTAGFVTGAFGLACAAEAVRAILAGGAVDSPAAARPAVAGG